MKRSVLIKFLTSAGLTVEQASNSGIKFFVKKAGQTIATFQGGTKMDKSDVDFVHRAVTNGLKQFTAIQKHGNGGSQVALVQKKPESNKRHHRNKSAVAHGKLVRAFQNNR